MKNTLLIISLLLSITAIAQKKPSEMSPATVAAFQSKLDVLTKTEAASTYNKVSDNVNPHDSVYFKNESINKGGLSGGQTIKGGTAVYDQLIIQGTSGIGTPLLPSIKAKVGNNGATNVYTLFNNGKVVFGDSDYSPAFDHQQFNGNVRIVSSDANTGLQTNGSFTTDTGWSKGTGVTISGGVLASDGTAGAYASLFSQTISGMTFGYMYRVEFDIVTYTAGSGFLIYTGSSNTTITVNSTGKYVAYCPYSLGATASFQFSSTDIAFVGTIDNVLVTLVSANTNGGYLSTSGTIYSSGFVASQAKKVTVAASATTFVVKGNVTIVTGDSGGNTIATITGTGNGTIAAISGTVVTLIFVDNKVTITDTSATTANTINLSAAFTSAVNTVLTLVYDGNKWFEVSRSVNG